MVRHVHLVAKTVSFIETEEHPFVLFNVKALLLTVLYRMELRIILLVALVHSYSSVFLCLRFQIHHNSDPFHKVRVICRSWSVTRQCLHTEGNFEMFGVQVH